MLIAREIRGMQHEHAKEQAESEPHMTTYTHAELAAIIDAQKNVLRLLLISIVLVAFTFLRFLPLPPEIAEFARPAILCGYAVMGLIGLIGAAFIYRLARAIHEKIPVLLLSASLYCCAG